MRTIVLTLLSLSSLLLSDNYNEEDFTPYEQSGFVHQRGLELNPTRFLRYNDTYKSFSGAFSIFHDFYNSEFRFPLYWASRDNENLDNTITTFDAEYRYYFTDVGVGGYYLGALGRAARLSNNEEGTTRFGAGISFGYRYMSSDNWYIGSSANVVNYFSGDKDIFGGDGVAYEFLPEDSDVTIQIDILNIGYRF